MEGIVTVLAIGWAISGVAAAFMHGRPGLWRFTIWLGPTAFVLFPPDA